MSEITEGEATTNLQSNTPQPTSDTAESVGQASSRLTAEDYELVDSFLNMRAQVSRVLVGQTYVLNQILVCLLSQGHVLLEGVPGLGKTLIVKALCKTLSAQSARVQFTPDLMPSDVMGHTLFDMKQQVFIVRKGPIFANLVLADEINRAPAKTQSALLEVMQEGRVTIEGESHEVPRPFMVFATQNPLEQEGTYPLPEAQLDRFLMKVTLEYPTPEEENQLALRYLSGDTLSKLEVAQVDTVMSLEQLRRTQELLPKIFVDKQVIDYAVRLVRATREDARFSIGAGPRALLALLDTSRAVALLNKRDFVRPDDVRYLALAVLRHRVQLSPEMAIEGYTPDDILNSMLESISAPRA